MRTVLELIRIIVIFAFFLGLGWTVIGNVYPEENYSWLGIIGIFILLFVLYRNKWQFYGWYKGKRRGKLPKKVSNTLISISAILVILPFVLPLLFS